MGVAMKKVIAVIGSRNFNDYDKLKVVLNKFDIDKMVSGGAKGADLLAERYATEYNIPTIIHKPDWKKYGRCAGFVRNKLIIEDADIVVAFWDGRSKGTKNSIDIAKKLNKDCYVILTKEGISDAF